VIPILADDPEYYSIIESYYKEFPEAKKSKWGFFHE
jgi:hypothetical protein